MEPVHQPLKPRKLNNTILQHSESPKFIINNDLTNLESLRKIICMSSTKNNQIDHKDAEQWQTILSELFNMLCTNKEIGNDNVLLASHAYLSLQRALYTPSDFVNILKTYFRLENNQYNKYNRQYEIQHLHLFKLIICNGFLQLGDDTKCFPEIYQEIFETVYLHCIRYTRYTYFAFKILQTWMQRSANTNLWSEDSLELEGKLEAIIFSNWDNAICKNNVVGLFSAYLDVMKNKYEDFMPFLFYTCVEKISWCHITKYIILSEICNKLEDVQLMTDSKFISNLFNSLTINHLCSASTKVYSIILNKLSKDLWIATFGEHLKNFVITWESEKKYNSLQVLCKCWVEPAIKVHRDILPFLLECSDEDCCLYRSHLLRIAKKSGLGFPLQFENKMLLDHEEEFVRLNAFAAHCYEATNSINSVKHFLYFNATTDTTYLREGVFNYFKIFLSNMLKCSSIQKDSKDLVTFLDWLHEFQLDCFEIGSCYQRKIFGLHLYKIVLQFLCSDTCSDTILSKDPNFREAMRYGPFLQNEMKESGKWVFTNKKSIVMLFKLALDPATDIKEISTSIIIDFFNPNIITDSEKISLFTTALSKCNSNKFFETDSGANLFKILTKWFPLNEVNKAILSSEKNSEVRFLFKDFQTYTSFLFKEAVQQLAFAKKDILKAATQSTPFYGIVTAIMVIGFHDGPESHLITDELLKELMIMCDVAINYFLNLFSSKSTNLEYSSSFQEMGLAIDEAIKNSEINCEFEELVLSPAQQTVITCIWRSLKVLCELTVELAKSKRATDAMICRAIDLIVTVSVKCRHKGVIESAGFAIANLTRYLCRKERNVDWILNHLQKLLNNDFAKNINLTRRGAGLTIMFHKIIASDGRTDRPFLHFAVNSLIQSLRESSSMKIEQREASNYDDPCAMRLLFLKTLVADKQLQPQLSPYMEYISLTCFEYMSSKVFIIRNASHQLFGAIVSRLVGQNTGAKTMDFGYGYSINYFATHFPQLAAHVLLNLQACCQTLDRKARKWQNSTSIIHVLSLLSKMFYSGCELIDGTSHTYVKQINNCLDIFMSSPVAHVRNLAAKCLTTFVGLSSIEQEICQMKSQLTKTVNFNRLNGFLYALEYLYDKQDDELQSTTVRHRKMKSLSEVRKNLEVPSKVESLWNFWTRRAAMIKRKKMCYAVEAQLLRLSRKFKIVIIENYPVDSKKKTNFEDELEKTSPGFFEFVQEYMKLFVDYISYNEDYSLVKTILGAKCIDYGIYFLKYAPRQNRNLLMSSIDFSLNNFDNTHYILLEEINVCANESIRNIFRGKMLQLQYVDISKLKRLASKLEKAFPRTVHLSELLLFIHVLSLRGSGTYDFFEDLISCISHEKITLANYFTYPERLRLLIAKGLEILLYNFDHLNAKSRITPLLASLVLMQDEVYSIRETIREGVLDNVILAFDLTKERVMDQMIYHTLLLNIVSKKTALELCDNEVIDFFQEYLSTVKQDSTSFNIENPFDDNNISPYKEESKIINLIVYCIQLKTSNETFFKNKKVTDGMDDNFFKTKLDVMSKMGIDPSDLKENLNISYDEYLAKKLKVANEVYLVKKN